jgi:hypothetical protein
MDFHGSPQGLISRKSVHGEPLFNKYRQTDRRNEANRRFCEYTHAPKKKRSVLMEASPPRDDLATICKSKLPYFPPRKTLQVTRRTVQLARCSCRLNNVRISGLKTWSDFWAVLQENVRLTRLEIWLLYRYPVFIYRNTLLEILTCRPIFKKYLSQPKF